MTPYTETLTLTLPVTLADIAGAIGRAMDPDLGGADSFHRPVVGYTEGGAPLFGDRLVCTTLCTPAFKSQVIAMAGTPDLLHAACVADYATRWPDIDPPSLEDCAAFCAAVLIDPPL